jgi:hypothetical protein
VLLELTLKRFSVVRDAYAVLFQSHQTFPDLESSICFYFHLAPQMVKAYGRLRVKAPSADAYNKTHKNRQFYNIGINLIDTVFFVSL